MSRTLIAIALVLPVLFDDKPTVAQSLTSEVPYVENGHERHVLDIYTPETPTVKRFPVMFWIHGGGWQFVWRAC